jgi:hypothetical protein
MVLAVLGWSSATAVPSSDQTSASTSESLDAETANGTVWSSHRWLLWNNAGMSGTHACPARFRNADQGECLAAVQEAVGPASVVGAKVVDAGEWSGVPSGCSYSGLYNGKLAVFNTNWRGGAKVGPHRLVCIGDPDHKRQSGFNLTLANINWLYNNGSPSNDASHAGLLVHQHDNTEEGRKRVAADTERGWAWAWAHQAIFKPAGHIPLKDKGGRIQGYWATSLVNRQLPGLYNSECGVVIAPGAARVLCSFYADFNSWKTGCTRLGRSIQAKVSRPRSTPYPPDQLSEMMLMSTELQQDRDPGRKRRRRWSGAPLLPGAPEYWASEYNEVLIDSQYYEQHFPWSVAAVFYVEGGDPEGPQCAARTRQAICSEFGLDEEQVLLLKHTPGAWNAFARAEPTPAGRRERAAADAPRERGREQEANEPAQASAHWADPVASWLAAAHALRGAKQEGGT